MRTNVYIDGFNLYYGSLRGTAFRWLDIASLAQKLAPRDQINRIRYFTARISARPSKPQEAQHQQTYLRALTTLPRVSLHFGHFLSRAVSMPLDPEPASGAKYARVRKIEEKGSDVNLATYLLVDAFDKDFDRAIVISNDSDLCEPINVVRAKFGLTVVVVNPHVRNPSQALRRVATALRPLRAGVLRSSPLPALLTDKHGTITKPPGW